MLYFFKHLSLSFLNQDLVILIRSGKPYSQILNQPNSPCFEMAVDIGLRRLPLLPLAMENGSRAITIAE
jgi:hypothetical protein